MRCKHCSSSSMKQARRILSLRQKTTRQPSALQQQQAVRHHLHLLDSLLPRVVRMQQHIWRRLR
jgi:hypothetical protein